MGPAGVQRALYKGERALFSERAGLERAVIRRAASAAGHGTVIKRDELVGLVFFQKAVDSLFIKDNIDIYITGSNAYLLSGELATMLSGRYVEINMLPLSFGEYRLVHSSGTDDAAFADYLRFGGLPYIVTLDDINEKAETYLEGIYNTIIIKDVEERQKRKSDPTNPADKPRHP